MTVTIKLKRAVSSGNVPSTLAPGELAVDEFTGKLFWQQNGGPVAAMPLLAPAATILGNNTGSTAAPTFLTTAQFMAMLGASPLASPSFTGSVTIPTLSLTGPINDTAYSVVAPVSGATVTIGPNTHVQIINPASALLALTLVFPTGTDGLRIEVATTLGITTLSCSAPGATIKNAPVSLLLGGSFEFLYVASLSTWFRVR